MVNVKIECGCGQRYAFEVEPVDGRMAATVACPVCGADGTAAANAIIASKVPPPYAQAPAEPLALTASPTRELRIPDPSRQTPAVPAGVKLDARALGLVDRETAATEARAKISWGDSQEDVIKYLMPQGFSVDDASDLVKGLFKERLAGLRVKGTKKIFLGVGLMFVPVIAWSAHLTMISLKLMGAAMAVGLWGCWLVLNGSIMVIAPKLEKGDVAE